MSKIKIKNFGPIKEGYQEGDGFMDINKVMLFIGNQGSGKSTVAKVIATMMWMEKALNRGDFLPPGSRHEFQRLFDYQGLKTYFREDSSFEYHGDRYSILYNVKDNPYTQTIESTSGGYIVPKIMYVPDARNFLSVIKNATGVRGLPAPLFEFADELKRSQADTKGDEIKLPINQVRYKYESESDSSFIIGDGYKVNMLNASSGFQSLVPMFLVCSNLAQVVASGSELNPENISVDHSFRMNKEIAAIMFDKQLPDDLKLPKVESIKLKYQNAAFINIVEEPEQNLFPTSQHQILNKLLEFNNMTEGNKLIMTTHSPYLINYLTLAVKAESLLKIKDDSLNRAIAKVVPLSSLVRADDLVIYELNEIDGTISKLESYHGLPSDENELNERLGETNELFAQLLEIEQGL